MRLLFAALTALIFVGCGVSQFSANTTASYTVGADGAKSINYSSNKEENGLDATYEVDPTTGAVKLIHIKVDKAGTSDAAIAAALQQSNAMANMFQKMMEALIPLLVKAAAIAATGGAAGAMP